MLNRRLFVLVMAIAACGMIGVDTARADELDDVKQRLAARYAQLRAAKQAGTVGETWAGYVEAVKGDASVASLVASENRDRAELYGILGKRTGVTPAEVGQQNGLRNFQKASRGEWLKDRDGKWFQKA